MTQPADTACMSTHALTLRAQGRVLVQDLTWAVRPGERWCVLGRNAAGKSTLLRALAGLKVPDQQGDVHWLGQPAKAWRLADAASLRAYVPQQVSDRFGLPVAQLLGLSMVAPDAARSAQARVAEAMQALDVAHLASRDVMTLSGGERQRVALAQALVQGVPLMLLDEPVSFQDPAHQAQIARWLRVDGGRADLSTNRHAWVISAHDINWVAQVATHVLALTGEGRWQAGPATEFLNPTLLAELYGCAWQQVAGPGGVPLWLAQA